MPVSDLFWQALLRGSSRLNPAGVAMSEVRIPRKHKGEVLSQSSEHAKAVRRQPKGRAGIKGRREFDMHAERGQQNVSILLNVHKC